MAAKSNVVVSEGQVTFKRVQGHKHDGLTSTLIDTTKYSMFDFIATENSRDASRAARQRNNKNVLKTFIIDTIEGRVLNPEGIRIQANAVTAREIVAGTITADELSSNIVLVNNVIRSNNYINNTTTYTGWAIFSNGTANFNNVNIRGNLATGAGVYAAANTPLYADIVGQFSLGNKFIWNTTSNSLSINAGSLTLGSNLSWDGTTLTITGNVTLANTNIGTFDNGDSITDGFIGGININSSEIQSVGFSAGSAGFRISSNGNAEFNNVTVRGDLRFSNNAIPGTFDNGDALTDGFIGGININANEIQSNGFSAGSAGFRIGANGNAEFNNVTVRGALETGSVGGLDVTGGNLLAGEYVADDSYGQYVKIDSGGEIQAYRKDSNFGIGEYYVRVDIMGAEPGIKVLGTADGSYNETRILSSFISTPTILLNGTSIATSLAGKSSTGHLHTGTYATSGHNHTGTYMPVGGATVSNFSLTTSQGNDATGIMFESQRSGGGIALSTRANGFVSASQFPSGTGSTMVRSGGFIYFVSSTRKIKENIEYLNEPILDFVKKLKPVRYTLKRNENDTDYTYGLKQMEKQLGFIVEDIEEIQNEIDATLITYDSADYGKFDKRTDSPPFSSDEDFDDIEPRMYKETSMISISIKAIQDLISEIDDLKARIQVLEGV